MKRYLLLLLMSLPLFSAFGQSIIPIPTNNTTWIMDLQVEAPPPPFPNISHNPYYFKTRNDTLINGLLYTIIETSNHQLYCEIRQDSALVYCKDFPGDTTEFVLYDFTLQAGDTAHLRLDGGYMDYVVTSVDSILIGNRFHKRIRIPGNYIVDNDFIEGIGSIQGLFYNMVPVFDWWSDLACFSSNDTTYSIDGSGSVSVGNCWLTDNINEIEKATFKIYPNPTYNDLFISGEDVKHVGLYNLTGQKLMECVCNKLNLQEYENGLYFLKVTDFSNNQTILKVIKNNAP